MFYFYTSGNYARGRGFCYPSVHAIALHGSSDWKLATSYAGIWPQMQVKNSTDSNACALYVYNWSDLYMYVPWLGPAGKSCLKAAFNCGGLLSFDPISAVRKESIRFSPPPSSSIYCCLVSFEISAEILLLHQTVYSPLHISQGGLLYHSHHINKLTLSPNLNNVPPYSIETLQCFLCISLNNLKEPWP